MLVNYNNNNKNKKPIYKFLFFRIFHYILPEKQKIEYKANDMNRKSLMKKLDIYNYLNLIKQVDSFYLHIQKRNIRNKNMKTDFIH